MNLLIVCILFIFVLHCTLNEGYINKPPPNKPDATQFLACMDDNTSHLGNNNYKIRMHRLGDKLEGPYTYFLDENKIRTHDELFHSPICEGRYSFTNNNLTDPGILDYDNLTDQDKVIERERLLEMNAIVDPHELFVSNEFIGNKLTYKPELNRLFLKNHRSHDEEQLTSRLNNQHVPDHYFNA